MRLYARYTFATLALLCAHCFGKLSEGSKGDVSGVRTTGDTSVDKACWDADVIRFVDPAFERATLNALERTEGPVAGSEVREIGFLSVSEASSLTDVRCFPALVSLRLEGGTITEIGPVSALANLHTFHMLQLAVDDLTPLAGLALKSLVVIDAPVASLAPLGQIDTLSEVVLDATNVSDISLLARQTQLVRVDLSRSPVESVEALRGLDSLYRIGLDETSVADFSPIGAPSFSVGCPKITALSLPVGIEGPGGVQALCELGWGVTWSSPESLPTEACPCGAPPQD